MIDRPNRDLASRLVRQFRDGQILSFDLEEDWPFSRHDRSLAAISDAVWHFYDDFRGRRMAGKDAPTPEEWELLTRYAAFLDTDLPYEWPAVNLLRTGGLHPLLVTLSLGLLQPYQRWVERRNARFETKMRSFGEFDIWPFIRQADYVINERVG